MWWKLKMNPGRYMRNPTEIIKTHPTVAVLTVLLRLLGGHSVSNVWWLVNDHHLFSYDLIGHISHTRNCINALNISRGERPASVIVAVTKAYSWFYPPLMCLGGVIPPILGWSTLDGVSFTNTAYSSIFGAAVATAAMFVFEVTMLRFWSKRAFGLGI